MPFVEIFNTDQHAIMTCGAAFFASWALGFVVILRITEFSIENVDKVCSKPGFCIETQHGSLEQVEMLGLSWIIHLVLALPLWAYVAYNAIYLERQRVCRIELLSEREAKDRRNRTLIPDDENVEWLNAVLRKVWGPLEAGVSKSVHACIQGSLDEIVLEPYLSEIRLADFSLGRDPPVVKVRFCNEAPHFLLIFGQI